MSVTIMRQKEWYESCLIRDGIKKNALIRSYFFNEVETIIDHIKVGEESKVVEYDYYIKDGKVIEHMKISTYSEAIIVKNRFFSEGYFTDYEELEEVSYEELPTVVRECYERKHSNS